MSIIDNINGSFAIVAKQLPSNITEIDKLKSVSAIDVPSDYLLLVTEASDVEVDIGDGLYIRIWGASGCVDMNVEYSIQDYIPKSLAIGDDEGGGAIIYMFGLNGFGIYYNRFADLDINEAVKIAPSLTDFLVNGIGVNVLKEL